MLFGTMIQWRNPYFIITHCTEIFKTVWLGKKIMNSKKKFFFALNSMKFGESKIKKIALIFFLIFCAKKSHFFHFLPNKAWISLPA